MSRPTIRDMSGDAVDVRSINYDWSGKYPEHFEFWEAVECDKCGTSNADPGEENCQECDNGNGPYYALPSREGPMMSYYYHLPTDGFDPKEAALKIAHLPLCVVRFEDSGEYALALTGGGMNLAWEICEAFMLLGYLPPLNFADGLPEMASSFTPRKKWVLAGARMSARVAIARGRSTLARLRRVSGYFKDREAKEAERKTRPVEASA